MADDNNNVSEKGTNSGKPEVKSNKSAKGNKESITVRLTKWFNVKKNEYLSEFKRIVWPAREVLLKETVTVILVSCIFGVYIMILDGAFGFLYTHFAQFASTLLG